VFNRRDHKIAVFASLACLAASWGMAQPVADARFELSGVVLDSAGKPVARSSVSAFLRRNRLPSANRGGIRFDSSPIHLVVQTSADGSFAFPRLPSGLYIVCARPSRYGQLGSCEWEGAVPTQAVLKESNLRLPPIVLKDGGIATIRLNRPGTAARFPSRLEIGVASQSGYFAKARLVDSQDQQRTYRASVPLGQKMFLLVHSSDPLNDAAGAELILGRTSLQFSTTQQQVEALIGISVK
jgi:hypothetical protein